jgi:hypothetical protein
MLRGLQALFAVGRDAWQCWNAKLRQWYSFAPDRLAGVADSLLEDWTISRQI